MPISKEVLMRILALAVLTMTTILATSAHAQTYNPRYPVCLKSIQNFGGERIECAYTSLAQCNQTALGLAAQCIENPYFAGRPDGNGRRYRQGY